MKNIITILSELGITVPEDKTADLNKEVAANYKTIAEHNKVADKLKTAEDTLKGFEGKDFDAITRERDEWKRKHDELEETHRREAEEQEFNDLLTAAIKEAKGKNPKAIAALLDTEALKASKNRDKDIKAALEAVKAGNDYMFDADDSGNPLAKFAGERKGNGAGGGQKKLSEMTLDERIMLKRTNPKLYESMLR